MAIYRLSESCAVASQIQVADVAALAADGFTTVICNRPDGEDFGQPTADAIAAACEAHDIAFHLIPIDRSGLTMDMVEQFSQRGRCQRGPCAGLLPFGPAVVGNLAGERLALALQLLPESLHAADPAVMIIRLALEVRCHLRMSQDKKAPAKRLIDNDVGYVFGAHDPVDIIAAEATVHRVRVVRDSDHASRNCLRTNHRHA